MSDDGVTIEFLSREKLSENDFSDKIETVLEKVRNDAVLVLEEAWTPQEKRDLIESSMKQVDEDFPGVEFMGLNAEPSKINRAKRMFFSKIFNEDHRRGLTIVGNSRVMEKIKEERDSVSFLAKLEEA
ncbi:OapB/ArvB family protein [Candidatus Nanohalococcus occultus]|uniref:DUF2073 domain-containing protein n=1 Tax=Candidatus Nanohalococcus occultus TaxID=2978047 RepID=A0ABY8CGX5_9ARCH|nr:Uncharacterized protein SVXNc_0738 [Candidatus Nanohaloarchaeota archaeon SVXNc]